MKIVFKDKTEFTTLSASTLDSITVCVENYEEVKALSDSLHKENNLDTVLVYVNEEEFETYVDMVLLESPLFRICEKHEDNSLHVIFGIRPMTDEEKQIKDLKTEDAKEQANVLMALSYLTDEQALTVKDLHPEYDPNGKDYKTGDRVIEDGVLYKCLQDHTSQSNWAPGVAPSLWVALDSKEHAGTKEDPIPVPDTVETAGFEYEYGKYYLEGDNVYLCERGGIPNPEELYGQKEILYYGPSALIGQYFEAVVGR